MSHTASFLTIPPDGRGAGLGNTGVASSSDANAMFWNPARYGFINNWGGFSFSAIPFNLISSDRGTLPFMYQISGFARINKQIVLASTYEHFYWDEITFTDEQGTNLGTFKPKEFSYDLAFAYLVNSNLSLSLAGRYIQSDLTNSQTVQGIETKVGRSFAIDLSLYWKKRFSSLIIFAWGLNISNIGNKISYTTSNVNKEFIPTNFRLGPRLTLTFSDAVALSFQFDLTKQLVPSPPVYARDTTGQLVPIQGTDKFLIDAGMNPNVSVIKGMIQSWYDAPGNVSTVKDENGNDVYYIYNDQAVVSTTVESGSVFKEELREIHWGIGMELVFIKHLYVRGGFYYEHPSQGNIKSFTSGFGGWFNVFCFDITYQRFNAYTIYDYRNLLRFTFTLRFGNPKHDYLAKEASNY